MDSVLNYSVFLWNKQGIYFSQGQTRTIKRTNQSSTKLNVAHQKRGKTRVMTK